MRCDLVFKDDKEREELEAKLAVNRTALLADMKELLKNAQGEERVAKVAVALETKLSAGVENNLDSSGGAERVQVIPNSEEKKDLGQAILTNPAQFGLVKKAEIKSENRGRVKSWREFFEFACEDAKRWLVERKYTEEFFWTEGWMFYFFAFFEAMLFGGLGCLRSDPTFICFGLAFIFPLCWFLDRFEKMVKHRAATASATATKDGEESSSQNLTPEERDKRRSDVYKEELQLAVRDWRVVYYRCGVADSKATASISTLKRDWERAFPKLYEGHLPWARLYDLASVHPCGSGNDGLSVDALPIHTHVS